MSFAPDQIAALQAPLSAAHVKTNPKGHAYVEGWHAIAEANRIFGFAGWDRQLMRLEQVAPAYETNGNHRVGYRAVVRVIVTTPEGAEIIRDGTGYGSGIGKDLNDCHEGASKEAETDAMKRALMTFGNPFGLALYDKAKANVEDAPKGHSVAVTAAMTTITMAANHKDLTDWLDKTEPNFGKLFNKAELAVVEGAYGQRWKALEPKDSFRGSTQGGVAGSGHNGEVFQ